MKFTQITNSSKEGTLKPYWDGWLQEKFPDHFAQIGTINTLRLKNAVRDVARAVMGSVPPDIERMCKGFITPPQGVSDLKFIEGYSTDEGEVPGSINTDRALQEYVAKYPDQWELAKASLALWRSSGRHAAGYVISNEPIDEFIPTTHVGGVKVLSFPGPQCESVGAIKMDFLVITALKGIEEAVRLVQSRHCGGVPKDRILDGLLVPGIRLIPDKNGNLWDLWDLPPEEEVFADLYTGQTETVFQYDTPGARQGLKYFNGLFHSEEDLSIFTALDRPGPLDYFVTNPENPSQKHSMLVEYSRRAKGLPGSPDIVKELDVLCAETKGVMLYQESLMSVYKYFTGCSAAEAEDFRRNIGKKKKSKVDAAYSLFMERATEKVGKESAQAVWDSVTTWSSYGFCHAHSRAYGKLAYTCLYLKHHYPLEWWCGVLRSATKDEIDQKFWQHCGHLVLLPDIKLSKGDWEIEGDKIRAPISMLFGIGETAHKQLAQSAPYTDLTHFCQSIIDYRKVNATYKDKTDKEGNITKVKAWGRSALDIGKIHNMLYAGSLESFFEGKTLSEAEAEYHKMMAELFAAEGQKYPKPKKKLPTLDPLGRYQAKKAVLPPYGADLRPLVIQAGLPENFTLDGRSLRIKSKEWSRDANAEVETSDPVVGGARIEDLERSEGFVEQNIKCGIIAYVESWDGDKRKKFFSYGPNKEKEACKFFIEVDGRKREMVYWPNRDGKLPGHLKGIEAGSVVAMIISKSSGRTEFNVRQIEVIRNPLDMKEKEDGKDKEEN
jgi:DNA polymerase III alpha subunit